MLDAKKALIDALNNMPEGINEFLSTVIPDIDGIVKPTTKDEAIIANGVLAYNVNTILRAFSGLTPVELLLRLGQHNEIFQGMLLSGLEYISKAQHEFKILSPKEGEFYNINDDIQFSVESNELLSKVSCQVVEINKIFVLDRLPEYPGAFMKNVKLDMPETLPATYSVDFTPTYKDTEYAMSHMVSFQVVEL